MSSVKPLLSAREMYKMADDGQNLTKEQAKKKGNGKNKKAHETPPQSTEESGSVKNGATASKTEGETAGKRRQNMDPPLVPKKKIKKSKQKRALGTPFIVKDLQSEKDQSENAMPSDGESIFKAPGVLTPVSKGSTSDPDGSDDSVDERFSMRLNDSYDSIGTLKLEAVPGEAIRATNVMDSREEGRKTFQWMIGPHSVSSFFRDYWEKQPLYLKRNTPDYYKNIFSTSVLDKILHEEKIQYSKNLDITTYTDGKRQTHNLEGQAYPSVVWDYYNNGCSLRLLNPQTFHRPVWKLLYNLQEHFNSFCGANVYLTPPGTQGFAPHWDDIEAFLLQLEGKKHWKVYKPRSEEEELPEISSPNLSQDDIGEPVLEVTLEAGDLLYFPRGYIHQAQTDEDVHSIHITVSTYQKNSWGHYLQKLLPRAVDLAMAEDVEFRRGLPLDHLRVMGVVNSDIETPGRSDFLSKVKELMERLLLYAPFDAAADQFGASLMHDALPPLLGPEDKMCSVHSGGERWCKKKQQVINCVELDPDTHIRLIRGNVLRMLAEEDGVKIYHCLENTREYHQEDPQFFVMSHEHAPAVEALIHTYPKYVTVESLPVEGDDEKMAVARGLWERGLVVAAHPLESRDDD
ncbi:ribosomal oxygenase 1-like isoform X2 [Eriocheir sinensis]|uniref:ribosomal oxygenase 1-like isoform X1 n=1 Tax=Eriocheir sinensis TaxID=95602 RepID=UPI0021C6EA02|nr:ribosomal oxygenase 1-like isoform X1 [Eriocheir sinensis]XP_050738943.1 ribosomal oxygenase 1-like isoform X2 [Eriocheir sinensis]